MIKGIGIDIIELRRIKEILIRSERFVERVLSTREIEVFQDLHSDNRKVEYLAGRFAAKEAYSKAIGTGLGKLSFKDIEVLADSQGAPKMSVKETTDGSTIFLSISHSQDYAVAQVIIER
ncbi:holo-ACP synthase [Aquibacillus saliphilus]|uniref:holo-ACP synthase n=1 Tax=Aquibacillus saliphilus TaxID=1909422 RepID=UPI001CF01776|nr:holo-ACP synthase [Aquibacillus saliphilus]